MEHNSIMCTSFFLFHLFARGSLIDSTLNVGILVTDDTTA